MTDFFYNIGGVIAFLGPSSSLSVWHINEWPAVILQKAYWTGVIAQ